jgi:ABC transporter substrate binding protein (PQQ-dependent alcohol dehydrogenase system)
MQMGGKHLQIAALLRPLAVVSAAALIAGSLAATAAAQPSPAQSPTGQPTPADLRIGYIGVAQKRVAPQPFLDAPPEDEGLAGARLGIDEDNTTGRFTGQHFTLQDIEVPEKGDIAAALREIAGGGVRLVVTNLPEAPLLTIAALPEAAQMTLFNAGAADDDLRAEKCRANLLDTLPSRAMLADALVQYLLVKQWRNVLLVVGPTDDDRAYADAVKRSLKKFQARLVAEKPWTYQPGARRSDTGHYSIQAEAARFTQGISYDVLVVADEEDNFGDDLSYRTYDPRPVAGTQGLKPTAWARPHQEWGATQLQNRFLRLAKRWMTDRDYAAWLAVRSIGESASRAQSTDPDAVMNFMRSDKFELGGFKGTALSYRDWDGQMRQAVLLVDPRSLVSVSPQPGFLHQFSELDTLGIDRPETKCRLH